MEIDILKTILGAFLASVAFFIVGGTLYMNPIIDKFYKDAEDSPALKKWDSTPKYVGFQFLGMLIQCLLWAFVFSFIKPVLPEVSISAGLIFGVILVVIKIFPRFYDMWIQTYYPGKLLAIEFINGSIGCFLIGIVFAYVIL